jgi:chemotaxis protein methyltransferase CheR
VSVVNQEELDRFSAAFAAYTGVRLRPRDEETLRTTMAARMKSLHLHRGEEYCRLLAGDEGRAEREWQRLIAALTNPETYFFRDEAQMMLLRLTLLPELIERNRRERSLRLWSAGCSTGEEAYSLAILIHELLPDRDQWDVRIVGTDINENSLEAARRGSYGAWSFRSMDPALRERYFAPERELYRVDDHLRAMVTFRPLNLVRDTLPDAGAGIRAMDLILCRNVFIYFAPDTIEAVLAKLAATLCGGGYLMTGHAEFHDRPPPSLRVRLFPGAVVYQSSPPPARTQPIGGQPAPSAAVGIPARNRTEAPPRSWQVQGVVAPTVSPIPRPAPAAVVEPEALLAAAERERHAGRHGAALGQLSLLLHRHPRHARALCLSARIYADLGEHVRSEELCRQAIEQNPLDAAAYLLLASIADERGNRQEAKALLKKVVYLAPDAVTAYLELAAIYASEGDPSRSRTMRRAALDVLRSFPSEQPIEPWGDVTAGELLPQVEAMVHVRE